jgi:hypothetical protein
MEHDDNYKSCATRRLFVPVREWIKAWARIPAATEITEFSEKSKRESL